VSSRAKLAFYSDTFYKRVMTNIILSLLAMNVERTNLDYWLF